MVALRKDVKLGLTLGGIVLSVIGVYVGLTALAGDKGAGNGSGASLVADGSKPSSASSGSSGTVASVGSKGNPTPPTTPIAMPGDAPRGSSSAVADTSHSNGTAPVGPSGVAPTAPITTGQPVAAAGGVDPWDNAFQNGQLAGGAPRVTETPDPAKVASNQSHNGTPASPSDIIQQLAQPRTGGSTATPPPTGASSNGTNSVASANDASGAITTGTTSQLTQITKHVVANGDTLTTIAAQYYGNGKYYQLIADANPSINPNRLKIGQELKIPAAPATEPGTTSAGTNAPAGTTAAATSSKGPIDPAKQYVVKANDSLHKIASDLYGDSAEWQKIYDANKAMIGNDPAKLKLGMVLSLPTPPTKHA